MGVVSALKKYRIELKLEKLEHQVARRQIRTLEEEVAALRRSLASLASRRAECLVLVDRRAGTLLRRAAWWLDVADQRRALAVSRAWLVASGGKSRGARPPRAKSVVAAADAERFSAWRRLLESLGDLPENNESLVVEAAEQLSSLMSFSDDEDDEDEEATSRDDEAIELDLRRTRDGADLDPLRLTLRRVCEEHPDVGYCQGMNFVAAFILRRASGDVDRAATVFSRLFSALRLRSVYGADMPGLKMLLFQLEALLALHLPHLAAFLNDLDLPPALYATSWFVTILVNFLPERDATVAWDHLVAVLASPPPPWTVDEDSNRPVALRGWALVFRVILLSLEAVADDVVGLSFDDTLHQLQNFPLTFKGTSLARLLASKPHAFEENEPLDAQLDNLRRDYAREISNGRSSRTLKPTTSYRAAADRVFKYSRAVLHASISTSLNPPPVGAASSTTASPRSNATNVFSEDDLSLSSST
ncbi:hypothetical protein CTAYLR_009357 [Chrysophaeum taylorii]|uniref:Rab-GAP TBC domain-containing protein n=1 Tax=Chrysophaeum taylorii TaxID=2483200 RepID=A0AAD7UKW9_9STRA|nr:hypothetical protein CTAYLR_009357 [Chrysophaeum taylorii]